MRGTKRTIVNGDCSKDKLRIRSRNGLCIIATKRIEK